MRHPAEKWTMALVIGLTVLLFALILMRWQSAHSMPPLQPVMPVSSSLKSMPVMAPVIQVETDAVVQNRPVFWQTRAPYVAPLPRQVKPKPFRAVKLGVDSFDKVKLSGMYSVSGETVLIVVGTDGSQRVRVGDDLAGWQFQSMASGGAIFTQEGEQRLLVMQKPTPPTKDELEKQAAEIQERAERRAQKVAAKAAVATEIEPVPLDDTIQAPINELTQETISVPVTTGKGTRNETEPVSDAPITFDSIWQERARKAAEQQ